MNSVIQKPTRKPPMYPPDSDRNDFSDVQLTATNALIAREFRGLGFRVEDLNGLIRATIGAKSTHTHQSETDFNSQVTARLVKNKVWAGRVLSDMGVSVSEGQGFDLDQKAAARALAQSLAPAVVKPIDGNQGKGVTVDVGTGQFDAAWANAAKHTRKGIIVERYFAGGQEARYLAIDGKLRAVFLRLPP